MAKASPFPRPALVMAQMMTPLDANVAGNVHGGNIMKLADSASGVVAIRHSGRNCVTATVDRFEFFAPVFVGNLVTLYASLNYVGRTSMEVGGRVEAEDLRTGKKTHTNHVVLPSGGHRGKNGRPVEVPPLISSRPTRTAGGTRRRSKGGGQEAAAVAGASAGVRDGPPSRTSRTPAPRSASSPARAGRRPTDDRRLQGVRALSKRGRGTGRRSSAGSARPRVIQHRHG
jgi:acyl-CoA hydrolase